MAHLVTNRPWVPTVETFGDRLVLLRRRMGLTQAAAAQLCDLDDGSWSNWENGGNPRNMAKIVRQIHEATAVDMPWLMWGVLPVDGGTPTTPPASTDTPPDLPVHQSRCTELGLALEEAA